MPIRVERHLVLLYLYRLVDSLLNNLSFFAPFKHYFNTHGVSKSLNFEKHQKLLFVIESSISAENCWIRVTNSNFFQIIWFLVKSRDVCVSKFFVDICHWCDSSVSSNFKDLKIKPAVTFVCFLVFKVGRHIFTVFVLKCQS